MKQRKLLAVAAAAVCILVVLMVLIWKSSRPAVETGEKQVTVVVIHGDGSEKEFTYQTDLEYLGELLEDEGLISGTAGEFGLYVDAVDGEKADYSVNSSFWYLYCNGEPAQTGADSVALRDGDVYTWVYTIG